MDRQDARDGVMSEKGNILSKHCKKIMNSIDNLMVERIKGLFCKESVVLHRVGSETLVLSPKVDCLECQLFIGAN